jgi:poly(hydroxyalkanoate) depolymerase family esterase
MSPLLLSLVSALAVVAPVWTASTGAPAHAPAHAAPPQEAALSELHSPSHPDIVTGLYEGASGTLPWRVARPQGTPPEGGWPTLVFLHGCTQDAADAAAGTDLDLEATAQGWMVIYPEQTADRHPFRCWNWYEPADFGEVALLMALLEEVGIAEGGDPTRRAVAGMSAGGAMAMLLATEAPEAFAAVVSHSGVDPALVSNQLEALQRMQGIAAEGGEAAAAETAASGPGVAVPVPPLLLIHGSADGVVSPLNLAWARDGWLARMRSAGTGGRAGMVAEAALTTEREGVQEGRTVVEQAWGDHLVALTIEGLGHAWSGGDPSGTYTDPEGPRATVRLLDFIAQAVQS